MNQYYSVEQGRAYVHKKCGATTVVNGKDFAELCNPFSPCLGTICARCGSDSTNQFAWADTGESVSEFRRRGRRDAPVLTALSWVVAPIAGAAIGVIGLYLFKPQALSVGSASIAGAVGAVATAMFVAPFIISLFAGERFYDRR